MPLFNSVAYIHRDIALFSIKNQFIIFVDYQTWCIREINLPIFFIVQGSDLAYFWLGVDSFIYIRNEKSYYPLRLGRV